MVILVSLYLFNVSNFGDDVMKTIRKINWFDFVDYEYITIQITPDSSVRNYRTEDITRTLADQFQLPLDRLIKEGFKIKGIKAQERASFEISFREGKIKFYMTIPKHVLPLIQKRLQSVWDKVSIEQIERHSDLNLKHSVIYESLYSKHDMFSLHTDAKDNLPLNSIIEAGRLVSEDEKASIFMYFDPMHQISWHSELQEAWKRLRSGTTPRKWNASFREIFKMVASGFASLLREIMGGVSEVISDGRNNNEYMQTASDPEASQFSIYLLSDATKAKMNRPAIRTHIWTIAEANDEIRADITAKTLARSFSDLSGDNELIEKRVHSERKRKAIFNTYETHKPPKVNLQANKMSTAEAGKLIQIPGYELQEKYKEIERIEQTQIEIQNKNLLDDRGLLIGETTYKSLTTKVYQPTNDVDELCLPHVGIGGMGQGKTQGLLVNYLLEMCNKGFGGLAIDPAKGEIGDEIDQAIKKNFIDADKVERIDLGKTIFALDFCEALYDERAKARLANIVVHFFNVADETTGQTERFLRAAVLSMQTGRISEIMNIFQTEKGLDEAIENLKNNDDEFNASTLIEYQESSHAMRRKILGPIYNRINDILGDPFLAKCLKSEKSLDLVKILSDKKIYVFDVMAKDLDKVAIDLIVSLLSLKIDLAMRMREKITKKEHPFLVAIDEPHQFSKSTKVWEDAVVESRKFRICYFWTFHYWEQIPNKLQKAIRSSLPHYHIYPTTTLTFQSLKDEISPFTVQDALKLKRWHAINIIRTGGENAEPFMAKMSSPPSKTKNILSR